jgi:hypothetical protein
MNCKTFKDNSVYYLENEISGVINSEMREHLQQCQECSKLYKERLQLIKAFGQHFAAVDKSYNLHANEFTAKLNKNYYKNSLITKLSFHIRRNRANYMVLVSSLAFMLFMLPMIKDNYLYKGKNEIPHNEPWQAAADKVERSTDNTETQKESNLDNSTIAPDVKSVQSDYTTYASLVTAESGFNIAAFDGNEFAGWLGTEEMLTFILKEQQIPSTSPYPTRSLAIYNLSTGKIKEFTDTKVSFFNGISLDKNYALYTEPKIIPEVESSQWNEELENGSLYNYTMKLLNIRTGEISDFKSPYKSKDAAFKWIDGDKLLATYPYENKWQIVNVSGNVLKEGPLNGENYLGLIGADIQLSKDVIKGTIYIKEAFGAPTKILAIDIETSETKTIVSKETAAWCTFQRGVMLLDCNQTQEVVLQSLDKVGSTLQEYYIGKLANVEESVLSPDGSKIALAGDFGGWQRTVILLDLTTGDLTDLLTCGSIENISWSSDGQLISLASRTSWEEVPKSYIINLRTGMDNQ